MGFTLLILVFIFIGWFTYERHKVSRIEKSNTKDYWANENLANSIRKKDISQLDYIKIPIESLPLIETQDEIVNKYQNELKRLSSLPILNLTGISNTDLKMEYGPANLNELSEADSNFTSLVRCVNQLGNRFNELGDTDNAIKILEYGIECNTDISNTYYLLAQLYIDTNQADKIQNLVAKDASLNSLSKNSIIKNLNEFIIF